LSDIVGNQTTSRSRLGQMIGTLLRFKIFQQYGRKPSTVEQNICHVPGDSCSGNWRINLYSLQPCIENRLIRFFLLIGISYFRVR